MHTNITNFDLLPQKIYKFLQNTFIRNLIIVNVCQC